MNCGQKEEAIAFESCPSTRVSHAKDGTSSVPFESLSLCKVQQGFRSMCRPVFICVVRHVEISGSAANQLNLS